MAGRTSKVRIVAKSRPKAIAVAIGPHRALVARGIMARIAAMAVSIIGLRRLIEALIRES